MAEIEHVDFVVPDEWAARPLHVATFDCDDPKVHAVSLLLSDGALLWMVVFPGGQRATRCSPATGYAVEERFTGYPPRRRHLEPVRTGWAEALECMSTYRREMLEADPKARP